MNAFIWNNHFITGIEKIDNQHKHLVGIVNDLGKYTIVTEPNLEQIKIILKELKSYTIYHFKDEEQLMCDFKISDKHTIQHKYQHKNFIHEITNQIANINPENDYSELFDYMLHWLAYHILGVDKEMARQHLLIEDGLTPEEAFEQEQKNSFNATEPLLNALKGLFKQVLEKNRNLSEMNKSLEEKVKERTRELSELNIYLNNLSLTDQLTGLHNRRYAIKELSKIWKDSVLNNTELSCLMVDADNFKYINDNYGHDSGDIVIRTLGTTLKDLIVEPGFVCRLGGDEFFIILPKTSLTQSIIIAKETVKKISEMTVYVTNGSWKGSISIGIASKTIETKNYEQLMKISDMNVYESKRAGKNCFRY